MKSAADFYREFYGHCPQTADGSECLACANRVKELAGFQADAFLAGQEAMRERAAKEADDYSLSETAEMIARDIRALPLEGAEQRKDEKNAEP